VCLIKDDSTLPVLPFAFASFVVFAKAFFGCERTKRKTSRKHFCLCLLLVLSEINGRWRKFMNSKLYNQPKLVSAGSTRSLNLGLASEKAFLSSTFIICLTQNVH